jgi:hypothetical protein
MDTLFFELFESLPRQAPGSVRAAHRNDPAAQQLCDTLQQEIDVYASFSSAFGHVFFIMQRS